MTALGRGKSKAPRFDVLDQAAVKGDSREFDQADIRRHLIGRVAVHKLATDPKHHEVVFLADAKANRESKPDTSIGSASLEERPEF